MIPQKFQIMNVTLLLSCLRLVPSVPTLENEMKNEDTIEVLLMKHGFYEVRRRKSRYQKYASDWTLQKQYLWH